MTRLVFFVDRPHIFGRQRLLGSQPFDVPVKEQVLNAATVPFVTVGFRSRSKWEVARPARRVVMTRRNGCRRRTRSQISWRANAMHRTVLWGFSDKQAFCRGRDHRIIQRGIASVINESFPVCIRVGRIIGKLKGTVANHSIMRRGRIGNGFVGWTRPNTGCVSVARPAFLFDVRENEFRPLFTYRSRCIVVDIARRIRPVKILIVLDYGKANLFQVALTRRLPRFFAGWANTGTG